MTGAMINAAGILIGAAAALIVKKNIGPPFQNLLKVVLGAGLVWLGLKLTWTSLNGTAGQRFKELGVVLLAMTLGHLFGRLMRLQKMSNALGQYASRLLAAPREKAQSSDGLMVGTILFCAAPLAILGSLDDGLNGVSWVLVVKGVIDGVTALSFGLTFGWSVLASALPVLAYESALIRGAQLLEPALRLHAPPLTDSINATNGLLIVSVALIVLEVRKVAVADYLPSLALAPLLTWLFR